MSLLRLKYSKITPPGYWKVDKHLRTPSPGNSTDYVYGGDLQDLCQKFAEYRIANNLQLGDTQAQVEDWICRNTQSQCRPANPPRTEGDVKASGAMVVQFFRYMAARFRSSDIVTQEEAERRAEICANCRFNVRVDDAELGVAGEVLGLRELAVVQPADQPQNHVDVCCHVDLPHGREPTSRAAYPGST